MADTTDATGLVELCPQCAELGTTCEACKWHDELHDMLRRITAGECVASPEMRAWAEANFERVSEPPDDLEGWARAAAAWVRQDD